MTSWLRRFDDAAARLAPAQACAGALLLALAYGAALAVCKLLPLNDALAFALALLAIFVLLSRCEARGRGLALHLITQILVLSWVFSLWTLGYEGRSAVFGGILPWSDSFDYTNDALRLIHGHDLAFGAKRPLYPVSLAALLRLFDGNLRLVLLAFAALGAWAVSLATNAVWKTHGRRAALIVFALLMLSERHWAGYVQTEGIGLPLGLVGFALIWRAVSAQDANRALWSAAAGLFAITMALMARAGAFFILPALALWMGWQLAPAGKRWRFVALAALAIVAGGSVHEIVLHLTAHGTSFSDYPPIVFGLLHHRDFTYLAEMHPELTKLSGSARALAAWHLVLAESFAHPLWLVTGLLRSLAELFYTPNGLFGFVWRNPDDVIFENGTAVRAALAQYGFAGPVVYWVKARGLYSLLNGIVMALFALSFVILTIAALLSLYRRPADRFAMLLRFALAGVLLSAPFTPPWITGSHQVQVATLAFMAAVLALGRAKPGRHASEPRYKERRYNLILVPGLFALAVIASATLLVARPLRAPVCGACHAMRLYPSTAVRVTAARTLNLTGRSADDLAFSLQFLKKHNSELVQSLAPSLRPGTMYILAYDAREGQTKILIDTAWRLAPGGWLSVDAVPLASKAVWHMDRSSPLPAR